MTLSLISKSGLSAKKLSNSSIKISCIDISPFICRAQRELFNFLIVLIKIELPEFFAFERSSENSFLL